LVTADDLIASMDEHNIDISIALNIAWSNPEICRETNDYILESIARFPRRLVGFCMIALDSPDTALREIERCAKNGSRGIGEVRPNRGLLNDLNRLKPIIQKIIETILFS